VNEITTTLPRSPGSARLARDVMTECTEGLSHDLREEALLLTSELVANALRHGKGVVTLRVDLEPRDLIVEVADQGHGAIEMPPKPTSLGGWGLRVVDEIATDWGVRRGSTRVWFRLSMAAGDRRGLPPL
jgi:anti-sigma regulatory factor (Ser/Thr protein kinase)